MIIFVKQVMRSLVLIISLSFLFCSCNRKEFKTYKGVYVCNKAVTTWTAGEPTEHYVTSDHSIEVTKEKKTILVQGHAIHIDSIEPNTDYTFSEDNKDYLIHFSNDAILFEEVDSADGTGTRTQYIGPKELK